MLDDILYMHRCLQLAALGHYYVAPNPMVGAVLVSDDGTVLAEGWHKQYGGPHAEVNCFLDAEAKDVTSEQIHDATLYVSLEPCSHYGKTPPCASLIQQKHPKRLVCGMLDPNPQVSGRGVEMVREVGIEVTVGVCEDECRDLNKRFLMLQEHHRPYVIAKWAQTADGYLDRNRLSAAEEVLVISTPLTKQLVHQMRAENMAILVGSRTALLDNPGLKTTRWSGRNPIRVLLDRHGILPADYKLLIDAHEPSDYVLPSSPAEAAEVRPRTIVYRENTDWSSVLDDLASRGIHSLIVEGGAQVLNSLLASEFCDEMHIEVNPRLMIGEGVPAPAIDLSAYPYREVDANRIYEIKR